MSKKLYVVSSFHLTKSQKTNKKHKIYEIVDARISLITALAKTICKGAIFWDDAHEHDVMCINGILKKVPADQIHFFAEQIYSERKYKDYDILRMLEKTKRWVDKGLEFEFKTTESRSELETLIIILEEMYPKKCFSEKEVKRILSNSSVGKIGRILLDKRDEDIISNVKEYGLEENILFVGLDHKLKALPSSGLEYHRANVYSKTNNNSFLEIVLSGSMPSKFKYEITELLKRNMRVTSKIKYL